MKKVAISLLCVILAGAIIFGFVYYNRHLDTTTDLQISKEKASDLNQNVIHGPIANAQRDKYLRNSLELPIRGSTTSYLE